MIETPSELLVPARSKVPAIAPLTRVQQLLLLVGPALLLAAGLALGIAGIKRVKHVQRLASAAMLRSQPAGAPGPSRAPFAAPVVPTRAQAREAAQLEPLILTLSPRHPPVARRSVRDGLQWSSLAD